MSDLLDWLHSNQDLFWWLTLVSVVTFVASLVLVPVIVARIPQDYFASDPKVRHAGWRHPVVNYGVLVLKNFLGLVLLLAGIAMLVLPGQGIITMLIGIMLMNFPGKLALERRIVAQPSVLRGINWIRAKAGRPPLRVAGDPAPSDQAPSD